MNHLFLKDSFDSFNLIEAKIKTFCLYSISGEFEKDFFKNDEDRADDTGKKYVKWSELKSTAMQLIKGHNTPLFMKFIFSGDISLLGEDIDDDGSVESLSLTVRFDQDSLSLTSAVNRKSFSLDRSVDELWDKKAEELLISASLSFD